MNIKKSDIFDILSTVANFAILITDDKGIIRSATPAVRTIFKKQEGEVEGTHLVSHIPMLDMLGAMEFNTVEARGSIGLLGDEEAESSQCKYLEYLSFYEETQGHFEVECTIEQNNRWLELSTYKLLEQNDIIFAVIVEDITQRKKNELEIRDLNENLEKRVEERTQQIKQVVMSCSTELGQVNVTYQKLKENIMDFMDDLEVKVSESSVDLSAEQKAAIQATIQQANMELLNLFSQDQITDQKFLNTINSLKELFEGKSKDKDNVRPEQMGGTSQDDVDDLLDSLGI